GYTSLAQQAFLLKLMDLLSSQAEPDDIWLTSTRMIGEYLQVSRAFFAEIEEDASQVNVRWEYLAERESSFRGRRSVRVYWPNLESLLDTRLPHVVADIEAHSSLSEVSREGYAAFDVAAAVTISFHRSGRPTMLLGVHQAEKRSWSAEEVSLLEEVAKRTFPAEERVRALHALRESEARYRTLFHAVEEGVSLFERAPRRPDGRSDFRFIAANAAMHAMFGLSDLSGQLMRDHFPGESESWYDDYDYVLDTGQPLRFERDSIPTGITIETFVSRVEDGSRKRLLTVMKDVTKRKAHERLLRESEERQAFLLKLSDAVRPLTDSSEIKVEAMRVLVQQLNVERSQFWEVDPKDNEYLFLSDAHAPGAREWPMRIRMDDFGPLNKTFSSGKTFVIKDSQTDAELSEDERIALAGVGIGSLICVPLKKRGRFEAVLGVYKPVPHDWTEHECALTVEVAERTWDAVERGRAEDALRKTGEQLRRDNQRKDEFLAILAHELRNPLAPIRAGLELMRVANNTPASIERVRSIMERQIGHMVRLIDDLLDVSRITSGKIQLQREPTSLGTLVASAIDANRTAMAEKNIAATVELPEDCVLDVDPTRLVQVLSNLLHNATKFTEPGGKVHISGRITHPYVKATPELMLTVADSGVGISAEFLPRIFDLFSQGSIGSSQPGLGIGLALARRLIEMHGGSLDARSEGLGRGSEFMMRLPVSSKSPGRDASTNAMRPISCRVVVIDDNRDAATTMSMLIEALGGECRTAYDGESGLREVLRHPPDLVLLDIGMSGMDGYETCRRIRLELGRASMIVAVTGYGQLEDRQRALRAGFDAHLTKPVDPHMLQKLFSQLSPGGNREPGRDNERNLSRI
ncbi:MAG: ATP-binding protein, partial [Gammaproteobacteria bacterium]